MKKCYDHEECEYNAQPDCALPDGAQCPHGVPRTNTDGISLAKMAQESLDDAMEMVDSHMEQTNSWIPFYIGKAWEYLELLRKVEEENLMEIEKLKDMLRNAAGGPVGIQMAQEAADALEQLQTENERLKAERDLAIKQLRGYCHVCKNYTPNHNEGPCTGCKHEYFQRQNADARDNWEWRGPKEEKKDD